MGNRFTDMKLRNNHIIDTSGHIIKYDDIRKMSDKEIREIFEQETRYSFYKGYAKREDELEGLILMSKGELLDWLANWIDGSEIYTEYDNDALDAMWKKIESIIERIDEEVEEE